MELFSVLLHSVRVIIVLLWAVKVVDGKDFEEDDDGQFSVEIIMATKPAILHGSGQRE